jgi:hypothetical protein
MGPQHLYPHYIDYVQYFIPYHSFLISLMFVFFSVPHVWYIVQCAYMSFSSPPRTCRRGGYVGLGFGVWSLGFRSYTHSFFVCVSAPSLPPHRLIISRFITRFIISVGIPFATWKTVVLSCQTQDCSVVICQCQGRTSTPRWWIEISVVPRVGEVIGDATPCCQVLFWDAGREYAQIDSFSRILVLPPHTHIVVL